MPCGSGASAELGKHPTFMGTIYLNGNWMKRCLEFAEAARMTRGGGTSSLQLESRS